MSPDDEETPSEASRGCGELSLEALDRVAAARTDPSIPLDEMVLAHVLLCPQCKVAVDRKVGHIRLQRELSRTGSGSGSSAGRQVPDAAIATGVEGDALIPGYRLDGEVHRGGQGVVFLAKQIATRRRCAVKMLIGGRFATSTQRIRFEREVEVVAALRHPSIVTLYESGVSSQGEPWFAMEYVDGERLDEFVRRTSPTPRHLAALFRRIADAVAYAHRRGVIHRDLKPGNILVDGDGVPRVLDFGLARASTGGERADARSTSTQQGEFVGTYAYAAPEQLTEDASAVDSRCDLYALGVILYECLVGEPPFAGCKSLGDLVDRKSRGVFPKPREAAAKQGVRIDRDLEVILLRLLAPDPMRRYETASAFAEDLARALDGRPILAREDSVAYVAWKNIRRYWVLSSMAGVLLLTVIASGIALAVAFSNAESERIRAEAERERVERAYASFRNALETADPEGGEGSSTMNVADFMVLVERQVRSELQSEPELLAEILQALGLIQLGFDDSLRAGATIFRAYEIQAEGHRKGTVSDERFASALHALARLRFAERDFANSEKAYRESLALRMGALGADAVDTVDTARQLASVLREQKRFEEAQELLDFALEQSASFAPSGDAAVARAAILNGRAVLFAATGDHVGAARELRATLDALTPFVSPDDFRIGRTLFSLARAEKRLGNLDAALDYARRSYAILQLRKGDAARSARAALELMESLEEELGVPSDGGA